MRLGKGAPSNLFFLQRFDLFDHGIALQAELFAVFLQKASELALVVAELFLTVFAGKALVRFLREALRMQKRGKLPNKKKQKRRSEQTVGIDAGDENQGREHHGVIPVIDAARATAFVFHKPGLEGTEE